MFGLPQQEVSEEEKKQHQEQSNQTVRNAVIASAVLWVSPIVWNFVKKQWK
ncbi:similar to Saccharomyces cerevisiae YPR133W-A TOM5 Component of the TOM (translocase of outer membrane) complex responsible for recognition and initial import of all mitochondrially directed proteins [Maudiozyma saulgeensis]|uniref:Similar to Saccharomyces cerevisiae YPR133W-A TOM5 Component of the TOM (Translocase of outer membrane) complex responsible for recognition and initial import of all mitochondrially directed proteins n=1 Tax=Maudiozyma saulgeensis TaxID=1789683 RepID=A0A1X7R9H9_9SACH|nr:similar to Saccharomyces cerevisiae YPR133W-A TOM5 Component of the TOM (translocase of outer membrane) complex responsible for recognition and initial import of all mitochondrially directed proteins [Kazachstania saulgeensis]